MFSGGMYVDLFCNLLCWLEPSLSFSVRSGSLTIVTVYNDPIHTDKLDLDPLVAHLDDDDPELTIDSVVPSYCGYAGSSVMRRSCSSEGSQCVMVCSKCEIRCCMEFCMSMRFKFSGYDMTRRICRHCQSHMNRVGLAVCLGQL